MLAPLVETLRCDRLTAWLSERDLQDGDHKDHVTDRDGDLLRYIEDEPWKVVLPEHVDFVVG